MRWLGAVEQTAEPLAEPTAELTAKPGVNAAVTMARPWPLWARSGLENRLAVASKTMATPGRRKLLILRSA